MLPRLILITDPRLSFHELLSRLAPVLALGPEVGVQLRLPGASGRALHEAGLRLRELCAAHENPLFVNGRLDVALALGVHAHLPVDAPRPREVRHLFPDRLISASAHSLDEARDLEGADLALVAPVFSPGSKPDDARTPLGPGGFAQIAAALPMPAFALGGISEENAASVEASGFAAIGGVLHATSPVSAARVLLERTRR